MSCPPEPAPPAQVELAAPTTDPDTCQKEEEEEEADAAPVSNTERRLLRDKMRLMFAQIIQDIDGQVLTVTKSQSELDSQLDRLLATLDNIEIDEKLTDEISANARRISSLKSRLTVIHTILSNTSARCSKTLAACGAAVNSLNASRFPPSSTQLTATTGSPSTSSSSSTRPN